MGWFTWRLTSDSDVKELIECICLVFSVFAFVYNSLMILIVNKENLKLNHCQCQQ